MSLLSYIGLIGGICSLIGYYPYARDIVRGKDAPERASWLIWTLSNILIVLSYWQLGARTTIWLPLAYSLGSAVIAVLAFTHGRQGWGTLEKLALIVAIISSVRWVFFGEPLMALLLNMTIGLIGYIPPLWKLAKDKHKREDLGLEGWTLLFLGSLFNLIAVSPWTPVIYCLPVAIFILNGLTLAFTLRNSLAQDDELPPAGAL